MTKQELLAALAEIRQLIKHGWCQRHLATNASGKPTSPVASDATAWCLGGAFYRVAKKYRRKDVLRAISDALWQAIDRSETGVRYTDVMAWNDWPSRTQADVLRLLDTAKILLGGREAS